MKYQAVIFDLDGTLIDSNGVWEKIDRDFLSRFNIIIPDEEVYKITAMSFEDCAQYFINKLGVPMSTDEIISECSKMAVYEYQHSIRLKPYALDYINFLKKNKIKIGIATASSRELYEPVLKNNGVYELFDAISTTSEVEKGKGYPDIYLLTAEKMGVAPEECMVFEDILQGVIGAKAANMTAYGVYDKYSEYEMQKIKSVADGYIVDFSEMLK